MLNSIDYRPENVETIYMTDWNVPVVTTQMRAYSQKLSDAIDAGNLTITKRLPTQSLVAALMFSATDMTFTRSELVVFLQDLANSFGPNIEVKDGVIAVSIEDYEQSAVRVQVVYALADLPA